VRFATDRETQEFKGFGYVEFEDSEATDAAVKLSGTEPGLLTQGVRGSHGTPWRPVEGPLDPLQIGKMP
jgi:RNA recognition motif-containing protein